MTWLPDWEDAAKPPTLIQPPPEEEEETPEEKREGIFYSHVRYKPDSVSHSSSAALSTCRFADGVHYPGFKCPHYLLEDEEGLKVNPRWTAQM